MEVDFHGGICSVFWDTTGVLFWFAGNRNVLTPVKWQMADVVRSEMRQCQSRTNPSSFLSSIAVWRTRNGRGIDAASWATADDLREFLR